MRQFFLALVVAIAAAAQTPNWKRIAEAATPASAPTLARSAKDGKLHAVWWSGRDLLHATLGADDGKPSGTLNLVLRSWSSLPSAPKLQTLPDGTLQVVFSEVPGLYAAVSKDGGVKWESMVGPQSAIRDLQPLAFAAASDREGKPVLAFASPADSGKISMQSGFGVMQPMETVREGACCVEDVQVGADNDSGEGWVAWRQNAARDPGLFVKAVKPAAGKARRAPASRAESARLPSISPRNGAPGVYLAYCDGFPVCQEIKLWNVRGGEALTIAKAPGAKAVWLTPGPEGRFWILWMNANRSIWAVRSNKALTRLGKPRSLGNPPVATQHLAGDGSSGPLDAWADLFHARLYAELELRGTPEGVMVTDLGDALEGVEIEVAGKKVKSGVTGLAPHPIAAGQAVPVKATHAAYAPATATLRAK